MGKGLPIATFPAVNGAEAKHPAWGRSVETPAPQVWRCCMGKGCTQRILLVKVLSI